MRTRANAAVASSLLAAAAAVLLPAVKAEAQIYTPTQAQLLDFEDAGKFGDASNVESINPSGSGIEVVADFGTNDTGKFGGDQLAMIYNGPGSPGLPPPVLNMSGPDSGFEGAGVDVELLGVTATGNSPSTTTAVTQSVDFQLFLQPVGSDNNYSFDSNNYEANVPIGQSTPAVLAFSTLEPDGAVDANDIFNWGLQVFPDDDGPVAATGMDDAGDQAGAQFTFLVTPVNTTNAWNLQGYGNYNTPAAWASNAVPSGIGVEADFFGAISAASSVSTDTAITLGTLHFNNANEYVLDGAGSLTMQVATGSALVQVDQGTDEINLPATLASNTTLNVASGASLIFGNPVTLDAGVAVSQSGGGTVTYSSLVSLGAGASLSIGNSTIGNSLNLGTSAKVSVTPSTSSLYTVQFNSLAIASGGTLDLANNKFVVNYGGGADPVATIASYLAAGYAGGKWTGSGITSSTVAGLQSSQTKIIYSVGYADAADGTAAVPAGQIYIMPTIAGDAKLQGDVNFGDFQILAQYFGKAGGWDEGNFTYGTSVDFGDFQELAQDFGDNAGVVTAGQFASLNSFAAQFGDTLVPNADGVGFQVVSVPEPVSAGIFAIAGLGLLGRRQRRRQ